MSILKYPTKEEGDARLEKYCLIKDVSELAELLFQESAKGHVDTVKFLLDKGVDINAVNMFNETALIYATFYHQYEVVKLLLERGADPTIVSETGRTALMWASMGGHIDIANIIRQYIIIRERFSFQSVHR